ncbi:MAG TPA: metallophosphoesterase [Ktedonobacterales bacterium]|nr:metallophosphoesterase [Ktedonobacterales bacterium]
MTLLAHVSDLHLDGSEHATSRARKVACYLNGLERRLDAVVITGDIAEHGLATEYEEARELFGGLPHTLMCPGNHDRRPAFWSALLGQEASEAPINQSLWLDGLVIAMCDTSIPGRDDGYLTDDTLAWLSGVLAQTPADMRVLIALHHPPAILHSPFVDEIRQQGEERLAELIAGSGRVTAVLCGHAHTAAATTFAGLPVLVAPGVVSTLRLPWEGAGDLDKQMPPAIAFHVIDDGGRITTHYRVAP